MNNISFLKIARPHNDILEGRLTMDVFAADLWKVHTSEAPDEYKNSDIFFRKTYLTDGLKNLIDVVEKRLFSGVGDSVIQLQTPFGGGKTHSLIALYHKAKEKNVNIVVIDGTVLNPKDTTLWEEMEKQLTGKVEKLKQKVSPGRENIENLLKNKLPILILMDEVLEYLTKASGVKVGDSNLAAQTLAFIQELTQSISSIGNAVLILSLPSSIIEHYDETGEKVFQQLQKIVGRIEKIYTPVKDEEVADVIKRRLFSYIDEHEAKKVIDDYIDYLERENLIPQGIEKSLYREKFIKSYPFQPEVIDVLYKRWGSFPTFQRTRGVLRILALVVHSLLKKEIPFIRISDFDLNNTEIRRELIKHIGQEYDSVISADITSFNSGAKIVDKDLGISYLSYSLGTKIATTIFLYSFSGGKERGASMNEIKLSTVIPKESSAIIVEAIEKLKEKLFYLSDSGLFFTNQPNLNRVILTIKENITNNEIEEELKKLIQKTISSKSEFVIKIWPNFSNDIPDDKRLKLVILKNKDDIQKIYENYGERPRIYKNTLIFSYPMESEKINIENFIKDKIAYEKLKNESTYNLTENQKNNILVKIKNNESSSSFNLMSYYRLISIPNKYGFKEINLGIPTYGALAYLDSVIYEKLKVDEEILEKLSAKIIEEKYLKNSEYIEIKSFIELFYKTPGEMRIKNDEVILKGIKDGVKNGLFGIGYKEGEEIKCKFFNEDITNESIEDMFLINKKLCRKEEEKFVESQTLIDVEVDNNIMIEPQPPEVVIKDQNLMNEIKLKLKIPKNKLVDVANVLHFINQKFENVNVELKIEAKEGKITKSEYEDKVLEAFEQAGIELLNE
ncbi:MAG: AAA family ATPase [Caldisericia bacterium]|jgi:hypothetical protein|nr:AAA family ATPase [Caldisericia bacterium]